MDFYKIIFVDSEPETKILEFTTEDINKFDILFNSKFSYQEFTVPFNQIENKNDIKAQVTVTFKTRESNFNKLGDLFESLNGHFGDVSEVIIHRNEEMLCDLKHIIDISSQSSMLAPGTGIHGFNLNICEGV